MMHSSDQDTTDLQYFTTHFQHKYAETPTLHTDSNTFLTYLHKYSILLRAMAHIWDSAECPAWPHLHDGCPRAGLAAAADGLEAALAGLVATEAAARSEQACI